MNDATSANSLVQELREVESEKSKDFDLVLSNTTKLNDTPESM